MKALKYGLALCAGWCLISAGALVSAQSTATQTAEVVPNNPNLWSANPVLASDAPPAPTPPPASTFNMSTPPPPEGGIPPPQEAMDLLDKKEYAKAVEVFEKFLTTAKAPVCVMNFLPYMFYTLLVREDADSARSAYYKEKIGYYSENYLKNCSQTFDAYVMRADMASSPDSVIMWMEQAVKKYPNYSLPYERQGEALWKLERKKEACLSYEKAKNIGSPVAKEFYDVNCKNLPEEAVEERKR